uniref:Uncharacterized protein n=1 Tax=Timema douglasi TaxID=61478 RepID=A0A7R8VG54_TIMDO|nr:unnamed protein product [Timema douglasi]
MGPLALSSASLKPILWDIGWEGERRDEASQPTKVSFRTKKNRCITETVDGASYRTGLAEKSYEKVDLGELMLSLCYLPTAGRLTLTIIKGRNFKAMDITGSSGIGEVEFRGSETAFSWWERGKPFRKNRPSSHNLDSNLNLPVLGTLAQHETSTLASYATEAVINTHERDSNHYLVVILSIVYCESDALKHVATEEADCDRPRSGHDGNLRGIAQASAATWKQLQPLMQPRLTYFPPGAHTWTTCSLARVLKWEHLSGFPPTLIRNAIFQTESSGSCNAKNK